MTVLTIAIVYGYLLPSVVSLFLLCYTPHLEPWDNPWEVIGDIVCPALNIVLVPVLVYNIMIGRLGSVTLIELFEEYPGLH